MTVVGARIWAALPAAATSLVLATGAIARPPTMQNSPGYDARLAESRKAWAAGQNSQTPIETPAPKAAVRPPVKKTRPSAK